MFRYPAIIVIVSALAACIPKAAEPVPEPSPEASSAVIEPAADECGSGKLAAYVNQLPTPETLAAIKATVGHDRIRVIRPGDAVTMDFRPDRLNVDVGEDGRIRAFRCT